MSTDAMQIYANQGVAESSRVGIGQLVDGFVGSQDVRQSSKALYRRTLLLFLKWLEVSGVSLSEVARPHIIQYKEGLIGEGLSALTVSSYITTVRKFFEWAEANKYYPNVAKGVKNPKVRRQFKKQPLTIEQAQALLDHYREQAARDYAVVNLLLRTGLRTVEVVRANVGDIVFKGGKRVLLVQGKGRDEKDSFVELTPKAYEPIADYLKGRGKAGDAEPLFTSTSNNSQGGRLTTRTISSIAKDGLRAIGLDEKAYTAHSLRHTAGVNILRAGGSLEDVQLTLRHMNPATTQIYTATLDEERRLQHSGESMIDSIL